MSLPVHPAKVLRLFAPLWVLLALSLWIHWASWQTKPILFGALTFLPLAAAGAAGLMGAHWRLELTREALIHHTLGGAERFEWARMGPIGVKRARGLGALFVSTFWFAYPLDAPRSIKEHGAKIIGRRLLCVFGERSTAETVRLIEDWRAQHARH
jgi:hypothetical protein